MLYTSDMQTKVGVHYHVTVGPPEVRLYNHRTLAGPYYDLIVDDMDAAHLMFVNLIDQHLPEYLDEDDKYESYEYLEYMTDEVIEEEMVRADIGIDELGLQFELIVCTQCVPKGMN